MTNFISVNNIHKHMSINQVGSNVNLLFQSKSLTFTPDQFNRVFQEQGFVATQGVAPISMNPMAPPVPTIYFSKGNLIVLYNPAEYLVIFQIINTLNFSELYEKEILPILKSLNFVHEIINVVGIECNTKISWGKPPTKCLTSLVKKEFLAGVSTAVGINNLTVFTVRLIGGVEFKENINIVIEPSVTDKERIYHFSLSYRTSDNSKFDAFVKRFGEAMILQIMEEAGKYV